MLKDRFNRFHNYLRISLTERCNMRCTYCMPEDGVQLGEKSKIMTPNEILLLATKFVELGVNKIRITGGEPLVCKDAQDIILGLSKLPVELSITTNGTEVDRFIDVFKTAGLRKINISLDSLNEEKFNKITRRNYFKKVMENIDLLVNEGFQVKINNVLVKNVNDNEILDFIEWTKNSPIQLRFIEFMPFDSNSWELKEVVFHDEILNKIQSKYTIVKLEDKPNSTTKKYGIEGYKGTFGTISTISKPFCDTCNRLRLTADGQIRNCLFGQEEFDLLGALRTGNNLEAVIKNAVISKHQKFGGLPDFNKTQNTPIKLSKRGMVKIGG